MQTKTCPFCMKTELKGYFFTPYSENAETAKEPYDTALNRACRNCAHCTEMERAIARREYDGLTRFCLTFVNGRGELKSLNIRFGNDTIIFTSPNYQETSPPAPYIIGQDETRTLKARLYTLHAEFWADFYGAENGDCPAWWELLMTFQNGKELHKKGTDTLPPQWNKLLKIVGVYYKWMLQDFSAKKCICSNTITERAREKSRQIPFLRSRTIGQRSRICRLRNACPFPTTCGKARKCVSMPARISWEISARQSNR